jgi:hypothetical protein
MIEYVRDIQRAKAQNEENTRDDDFCYHRLVHTRSQGLGGIFFLRLPVLNQGCNNSRMFHRQRLMS